jgi:F-type H+-transporting ATPase subunit b
MIRPLARALFLALLIAAPALAAGDGGGHHEPSWSLTLLGFVNFAIFLFIMKKFAWPLVVDYLLSRRLETLQALEAAAQAKREAEEMKAEFERKMASLESETAKARDQLLAIARNEAAKVVAHAEATAERLKKDAGLLANQEVARARRLLQEECAQLIAKIAGELVSKELTDDDQKRFVDEFVKESAEAAS